MVSCKRAAVLIGAPPLANFSNCPVSSRACCAARAASRRFAAAAARLGRFSSASETLPMITVRMLLKSCAMPPASTPSDSTWRCLRASAVRRSCSVMSRTTSTAPMIAWPARWRSGETLKPTMRSRPSRARRRLFCDTSVAAPRVKAASRNPVCGSRRTAFSGANISTNGRPAASVCDHPVSCSATGFRSSTRPAVSVVMTPSPMHRSVTPSRSVSSASASCERRCPAISRLRSSLACVSSIVRWRTRSCSSVL